MTLRILSLIRLINNFTLVNFKFEFCNFTCSALFMLLEKIVSLFYYLKNLLDKRKGVHKDT